MGRRSLACRAHTAADVRFADDSTVCEENQKVKFYVHRATVALAMLVAVTIQGCNTMEGMGEDLEHTGETIQEEASDS